MDANTQQPQLTSQPTPAAPLPPSPQAQASLSSPALCPVCHQPVPPNAYFCPNCGAPLRTKPPGIGQQLSAYLVSFFLPPFGLAYSFKFLRQNDPIAKRAGWITIILTVVSLILTVWLSELFINSLNQSINQSLNQVNLLNPTF